MAGLYDTLTSVTSVSEDLSSDQKDELSKWITSITNKELIKNIFLLISEHAKRNQENYTEPYGVLEKVYKGVKSSMFSLNELPRECRIILWNFYLHTQKNNLNIH